MQATERRRKGRGQRAEGKGQRAGGTGGLVGVSFLVHKSRPTQNKRARERARQERQQHKAARRAEVKQRKSTMPASAGDEDPDIAGIVPGPQPNPWGDDLDVEEDVAESKE